MITRKTIGLKPLYLTSEEDELFKILLQVSKGYMSVREAFLKMRSLADEEGEEEGSKSL